MQEVKEQNPQQLSTESREDNLNSNKEESRKYFWQLKLESGAKSGPQPSQPALATRVVAWGYPNLAQSEETQAQNVN